MSSKRYYNSIAKGYDNLYGDEQRKKWAEAKKLINFSKKDIVLDMGCGTGLIIPEIAQKTKIVVGIDNSVEMLKLAPKPENAIYVLADAKKIPFPDKFFDKTISLSVLQDIKEWKIVLKEIKRVTKGAVVLTILKRNKNLEDLKDMISKHFKIQKVIEEQKDFIFVLGTHTLL